MTPAATERPADAGPDRSPPTPDPPPPVIADAAYRSEPVLELDADDEEPKGRWWTRTPLRVKLVAAVLGLMTVALLLVGAASVVALQSYLVDRVDGQLDAIEAEINRVGLAVLTSPGGPLPSDFKVALEFSAGTQICCAPTRQEAGSQARPNVPADLSTWRDRVGDYFTIESADRRGHWRVKVSEMDGRVMVIAEDLSDVDYAVGRLILIETLVGIGVLIALGLASVWIVRLSLKPLVAIERTAAAIAGGDLTQRVPELDRATELGQLTAALNTMLSQVEAAFRARAESEQRAVGSEERMRQFVADASHELRTPLTTIRGFAELYRQGAAPDPAEVLHRIEDEAARMGLLVEDLLLLARLDQERPLRLAAVPLTHLIGDAAAAAHVVAPDRTIEVDLGPDTDALTVNGDEARLRQVVDNLVTNALTHTPAGTPVTLRLRADAGTHAVIEVADRGPGLTPEQAARVFERFYRVDKARTRRAAASFAGHSGTGLGLAIVSALVAAHRGTVEVDSEPGGGATFRVRLPLA
jgi:two-component system OmpR family sensor kinase